MRDCTEAARLLGLELHPLRLERARYRCRLRNSPNDKLARSWSVPILFSPVSLTNSCSSSPYTVPTIYHAREFVAAGGLMSYGASTARLIAKPAPYRTILKGEKPADLPVQQSTKFELVINLNTAKALKLTFPPALLAIADEVIE